MNEKKQNSKKEFAIKIVVIIVIIGLIVAVWFYKNMNQIPEEAIAVESQDNAIEGYIPLDVVEEFDLEKLKSYGLPIIIDFGADSCDPCKEMAPVLKKVNIDLAGKAIVMFADVWKYQELAKNYPVEVIPTQILIDVKGNPYVPSEDMSIDFIKYMYKDTGEHVFTAHQGGLTEEQILLILKEMGLEE